MRAFQFEGIDQRGCVGGHVVDQIGGLERQSQHEFGVFNRHIRHTQMIKMCGEPDIAIIKTDHAKAFVDQHPAERIRPQDHLHRKTHDE